MYKCICERTRKDTHTHLFLRAGTTIAICMYALARAHTHTKCMYAHARAHKPLLRCSCVQAQRRTLTCTCMLCSSQVPKRSQARSSCDPWPSEEESYNAEEMRASSKERLVKLAGSIFCSAVGLLDARRTCVGVCHLEVDACHVRVLCAWNEHAHRTTNHGPGMRFVNTYYAFVCTIDGL